MAKTFVTHGPKPGMKKKFCVFTFVKNEQVFLPIWLNYYSRIFNEEDIYVIDHDSTDGSIESCEQKYRFTRIPIHWGYYDAPWKTKQVCSFQKELLKEYEYVLYTDADEIIVPDPAKYSGLMEYIQKMKGDTIVCTGFNLIHLQEKEAPIDLDQPILKQRSYWYPDRHYNKPLISRVSLEWCPGFHWADNCVKRDPDLWLLHLHKMDFDLCWSKHQEIAKMKWNPEHAGKGYSVQFQVNTLKDFNWYFRSRYVQNDVFLFWWMSFECFVRWSIAMSLKLAPSCSWSFWKAARLKYVRKIPRRLLSSKILE